MPILQEAELSSDDEWLARCRKQEAGAWREFFDRYHGFVRRSARRLGADPGEVDDVVQEAFTVAYRHIGSFRGGRMTSWLFRIVSNAVSNRGRARRLREGFLALLGRQPLRVQVGPEEALDARDAQARVRSILSRLSPKRRDVFALFELEGLSGEEIAQLLEINLSTVWTRLHHARRDFERYAKSGVLP